MTLLLLLLDPFDGRVNVLQATVPNVDQVRPFILEEWLSDIVEDLQKQMRKAKGCLPPETFIPPGSTVKVSVEQTTEQFQNPGPARPESPHAGSLNSCGISPVLR